MGLRDQYRDRAYQAALHLAALCETDENLDDAAEALERATRITAWKHLIDRQDDSDASAEVERCHRRLQQLVTDAPPP